MREFRRRENSCSDEHSCIYVIYRDWWRRLQSYSNEETELQNIHARFANYKHMIPLLLYNLLHDSANIEQWMNCIAWWVDGQSHCLNHCLEVL